MRNEYLERRLKCLMLTDNLLLRHGVETFQMVRGDSLNINEVVAFIKRLGEKELLPRDTIITWVWYSPRHRAYGLLLWSEMFPIEPEGQLAPYIEII